ncbi:MAG: bifunctional phosphoribosylaminoimidazolecarboxamide formyltransferase/IMP cyclohydrolase [Elusimicrobia bacterium]|nr:bifunctional phosphoribosylaminoimidazolecarboxamide formyltransferase/IMP cyclohydrolase [Elusimicrobiota bacterium]
MMIRIAVFASGEGTNLQALLDAVRSRRVRGEIALVVSSNEASGAVTRARRAGIACAVLAPKQFQDLDEYSAALAAECKRASIDLICLAGFMHQLKSPLLTAFSNRILNIHPALLPAFGGKGMYGPRVHEAVLKAGARVSGCTVHFVDEIYDHGPIVSQHAVAVLPFDTPATLAARVRTQEHWAYPEAVRLFCEGRLRTEDRQVRVAPSSRDQTDRLKRALLSVSDKAGIVEFCRGLQDLGIEVVSTSGTAKALTAAGIEVRQLDTMTGFPEILQGRVKTLHPKIHGAILLRRCDPEQLREAELFGIEPIDLVVVNLYPFAQAAANAVSPREREVIEQIDIGGVALIRAAAKNFDDVTVVVSPQDYGPLLREIETSQGRVSLETRKRLAAAAFRHTAQYDTMIGQSWSASVPDPAPAALSAAAERFPATLRLTLDRVQTLRYGENPHQAAALYAPHPSPPSFEQLHGKELSYNNLLDAAGAWELACDLPESGAVVFKHATPCGVATGDDVTQAFSRAWRADPLSAFGGIVALNRPLSRAISEALLSRFVEVVVAPDFEPEALEALRKKASLRLLRKGLRLDDSLRLRSIDGDILVTEPDRQLLGEVRVATRRAPSAAEDRALRFAWIVAKHVRSNAIVLAGPDGTVGIGAGQMSRVDAVAVAGMKFRQFLKDNPPPPVLAMASDAFFPFRDGIDAAADIHVTAVIQPGGSVRDAEVVAAADEHGMAMTLTGMRHFKH